MEQSKIEWTDHTFNPWMGCTKVSPACKNCYAERDMDHRYGKVSWGPKGTRVLTADANWKKPIKWDKEAREYNLSQGQANYGFGMMKRPRVFCASLADVFESWGGSVNDHKGNVLYHSWVAGKYTSDVPPENLATQRPAVSLGDLRRRLFELIDSTPNLDWLLLTKRPQNFERMWDGKKRTNVWLGTSIENQQYADSRLQYLHDAKRSGLVAKTFVSAEPLVGPIYLQHRTSDRVYNHLGEGGLDWVITGGESGPGARACDPDWFRSLRDQCKEAGTPFHFKQWGEYDENQQRLGKKKTGRMLDGELYDGVPS